MKRLLYVLSLSILLWGATPCHGQTPSPTAALERMGLVDVALADTSLIIQLVYTTADNFTGKILYEGLDRAFLQPEVAEKLLRASVLLRSEHPDLRLIVYDAARPMSVQRRMFRTVAGTSQHQYVSNPAKGGGLHNYAAAVDVTLATINGNPLPMGTPFDHFGPEAHITREDELVAEGKITRAELDNRLLLRSVMTRAGFLPLHNEWWHFNSLPLAEAKARYPLVE